MNRETLDDKPGELAVPIRNRILDQAATLFADRGYEATSVRDIAAAVGISAPALYNHFRSKEEIFCATHARGMETITCAVEEALKGAATPWDRLEVAASAHCASLLGSSGYRTIINPQFPKVSDRARNELIAQRDAYEQLIRRLIADLALPESVDAAMFRMHLLGALNWSDTWYRDGGATTPEGFGRSVVGLLRQAVEHREPEAGTMTRKERR